ncbi:MAG: hypothetical protein CMP49_03550 [Flavobacteriales bacterium]|nr:hypothetical protein [Flavobacteriales bacterium]|tara:strand:+ start:65 stop:2587 length:2523 start_codon:yes stop_codon:yes gene_type:complete
MRYFLIYTLFIPFLLIGQNKQKEVIAKRINTDVIIDGKLNELFWSNISTAKDFQMMEPVNGKLERVNQKTEVKFAYDNNAIYIGARLNDKNAGYDDPNIVGILKQLGARDDQGKTTDVFGIFLNPFNDGINEFAFLVTAAGVQIDKRIILTTNGYLEDINWDSVWESAVSIDKDGWSVEMKIPYSAIRFPDKKIQEWGLNIYRELRRFRESYSWNLIDLKKHHIGNQAGLLKGIKNIDPPIRLSLTPYLSTILLKEPNQKYDFDYSGGIDLKYGFTTNIFKKSFNSTLDMTILPEFQQVEFDPLVLNISPFETKFDEKRSFFTEGTELFTKGNLFYSRRIGGPPAQSISLQENEIIYNSPTNISLLNAAKISGRTDDGWGIGIFNAITNNTYCEVTDTITNETREELIEPLTQYSMIVLDKSFKKNSFLTFVNTNVYRRMNFRKANVFGILGSITNKKETHAYDFSLKNSLVRNNNQLESGFSSSIGFYNTDGNIKYQIKNYIESDKYEINDMGFLYQNNEINTSGDIAYEVVSSDEKIAKKINILKGSLSLGFEHRMLYNPLGYNELKLKFDTWIVNNNYLWMNLRFRYFFEEVDPFESRINNQKFIRPPAFKFSLSTSSNFNNPISLNLSGSVKYRLTNGYSIWEDYNNMHIYFRFNPRIIISNHAFIQYIIAFDKENNQFGWIPNSSNIESLFSRRKQKTITNKLIFNYTFTNKLSSKIIARHYWSVIDNQNFYELNNSGELIQLINFNYDNEYQINFNTWNLDWNISWEYKPGSNLSIVWQNQLTNQNNEIENVFFNNINNFFNHPTTNIISVKFTSYLDYSTTVKDIRKYTEIKF